MEQKYGRTFTLWPLDFTPMFIRKGFVLQILLTFRINKVPISLIQINMMTLSPFYIYTVVVLEPVSLKYYCIETLIIDTF